MILSANDLMGMVDWSRAQFAMTAIYHWLFVPLTLGLGFICAIMETIYYRTGDPFWKRTVKFWMRIFGINFAIGVATGLILEFEFGTNWSNYSYFVGDIFGAPLAIEGIMAFFLESTFFAVMFFGWNRVSRGFHLASTWLTAIGANLSALWILVANAWMQYPVGTTFNPDTARHEMTSFWDVLFSPHGDFGLCAGFRSGDRHQCMVSAEKAGEANGPEKYRDRFHIRTLQFGVVGVDGRRISRTGSQDPADETGRHGGSL